MPLYPCLRLVGRHEENDLSNLGRVKEGLERAESKYGGEIEDLVGGDILWLLV